MSTRWQSRGSRDKQDAQPSQSRASLITTRASSAPHRHSYHIAVVPSTLLGLMRPQPLMAEHGEQRIFAEPPLPGLNLGQSADSQHATRLSVYLRVTRCILKSRSDLLGRAFPLVERLRSNGLPVFG